MISKLRERAEFSFQRKVKQKNLKLDSNSELESEYKTNLSVRESEQAEF